MADNKLITFYGNSLEDIVNKINNFTIKGSEVTILSSQIFNKEINSYTDPSFLAYKKRYNIKNSEYSLPFTLYEGVVLFSILYIFGNSPIYYEHTDNNSPIGKANDILKNLEKLLGDKKRTLK